MGPAGEFMRDVFSIASMIVGIALITLLVNPRSNTTSVIQTSGDTLNKLLQTVTLSNATGFGNGAMNYPVG